MNRVISYVANEVIVKALANNVYFQRFAVKTVDTVKKVGETAADTATRIGKDAAPRSLEAGSGFFAHLREEVVKDLNRTFGAKKP